MLTQELDRETERYLADILTQQKVSSEELIRQLIRDRWLSLQHSAEKKDTASESVQAESVRVESSQSELPATELPKPKNQKQIIADFVRRKVQRSI